MKIYCDGSSTRYCFSPEGLPAQVFALPIGKSHNEAEYMAVIAALDYTHFQGLPDVEILTDSQLVVKQVNLLLGRDPHGYKVKRPELQNLSARAVFLISSLPKAALTWVPRELNVAGRILG